MLGELELGELGFEALVQLEGAGRLAGLGGDARSAAMLAKLQAVAAAGLAADEGIQILGGYGYVVEYHVERHYRDAKSLEVMDGVAEALRDELASQM